MGHRLVVVAEGGRMGKSAIEIKDLKKTFGNVAAIDHLDLEVEEGELFGLLGPNGAGKSTAINILCGLLEPTDGSVHVGGYDIGKESHNVKELIGVCPQEMGVFPYLTGRENVEFFGNMNAVPKAELRNRVNKLLEKMALTEDADRKAKTYSGGMKRRISLIMALVSDPKIAFLDEPTTGMDPQSRRAVWDFLKELGGDSKTIILTTHYMEEAEYLCDRVGIIDHGRLIALGKPTDLMKEHNVANLEEVFLKLTGRKIREAA
jgi:ABC-2 type transport system ATP-binding protein